MNKVIYILLSFTLLLLNGCKSPEKNRITTKTDRIELYDRVWNTVNEQFYDPNFNDVDWKAKYEEYKPLVENCTENDSLFILLNDLLFELNSSHCGIGPISKLENNLSPYLFADGIIGIDIRIIDNEILITRVSPNSVAATSGLKVGYVIKKIDGLSLDDLKRSTNPRPPFNDRNAKFYLTTEVLRYIYGKPASKVIIEYLDEYSNQRSAHLIRTKRKHSTILTDVLPPVFLESESFFINDSIAYLAFNAFQPEGLSHVMADLQKVMQAKGLVIDLRGNDGGSIAAMKLLLGKFVTRRTKWGTYSNRHENNEDFIEPVGEKYKGKVVVLVDEMSISGAENTPAIIQHLNIATIIGMRTPGQLLWGDSSFINDSILMVLPIFKIEYPNGYNPENNGVEPDIEIALDKKDLLKGIDTQLAKAIEFLSNK